MIQFNDLVTVVDPREKELREVEVLIKLVPFVERDVEDRVQRLRRAILERAERLFPELIWDFPAGGGVLPGEQ